MTSKALLLDLDGVVLHQPRVMQYLTNKVAKFVRSRCPRTSTNVQESMQLNHFLYSNFGHTMLGMRALYGSDAPKLEDFHRTVYDEEMLTYLHVHKRDDMLLSRAIEVGNLLEKAKEKRVPCYIFSNAPHAWCEAVLKLTNVADFFEADSIMSSDHPVFQNGLLKPDAKLYSSVADYIRNTQYDKDIQFVFIDDSFTNLKPVLQDSSWSPIYLVNEGYAPAMKHVRTIRSMANLVPLI